MNSQKYVPIHRVAHGVPVIREWAVNSNTTNNNSQSTPSPLTRTNSFRSTFAPMTARNKPVKTRKNRKNRKNTRKQRK